MDERALTAVTVSVEETESLGRTLQSGLDPGRLVLLTGPLGAGKTAFVRGMATALGVPPERVRSPTFVLHHVYRGGGGTLHHLDLYRLGEGASLEEFDLDGLLDEGTVAVEWGELGRYPSHASAVTVRFELVDETTRRITAGVGLREAARS